VNIESIHHNVGEIGRRNLDHQLMRTVGQPILSEDRALVSLDPDAPGQFDLFLENAVDENLGTPPGAGL
jgi:hypothetical protein